MAGFSGGRKGVCPALADLATIQRFHGFETLSNPKADNGILEGNPCHEIARDVAGTVGVDFLLNVALTQKREIAGVYCGDLEEAHLAGCREVSEWTTAGFSRPFDLVVTNGGGFPLDLTFYQTVKGLCTALPALHRQSTLLQVSECAEGMGSPAYTELMMRYGHDWKKFLRDIRDNSDHTELDQWELQMQCRVLQKIGRERLLFVSDGLPGEIQSRICVNPVSGPGTARQRAQRALDDYLGKNPSARIAVIPDGPYTMLKRAS
jgi:nickel-dependent lactate racemase